MDSRFCSTVEDTPVCTGFVGIPSILDTTVQEGIEDRRNRILALPLVVVKTSRGHQELMYRGLVRTLKLPMTAISLTEILECRMEKPNIKTFPFRRTSVVKRVIDLLLRNRFLFRRRGWSGCKASIPDSDLVG